MARSPDPVRRQSASSHQDAGLMFSNHHGPHPPNKTAAITPAGEIRPSLDFVQPLCSNNHGPGINNTSDPPTRAAGHPHDPHLPHRPTPLPAYSTAPSDHHQPRIASAGTGAIKLGTPQKPPGTHGHKRTQSHPSRPSGPDPQTTLAGSRGDPPGTQPAAELAANHPGRASPPALARLTKKNGKPLARCPFCGMTFKKLEHCQRHERTHTLARPYSCAVCSKTFARQDTLNRHSRLHSRSDGKMAIKKSSPTQPTGALASPSKLAPRNPISSPVRANFDLLAGAGSGVSPSFFASPPHAHRRMARERGLSLSALEHSSLPGHLRRDPSMASSGPRQSISLPLSRHHQEQFTQSQHQPAYPFHYDQAPAPSSRLSLEIVSPPSDSSAGYAYAEPMEARRVSWCTGGQSWSDLHILPPDDPGPPPPSTRGYRPQPQHLSLGAASWSKTLTNTFGLVEGGIGPVPLSAPATCTDWGAPLVGSGAPETSNATVGSFAGPRWETLPQYDGRSSILPGWSGLGRLEEEQIKLEPESSINSTGTSQLLLSSPSQPGSFDQPNSIDNNCSAGLPSTGITHDPLAEANPSVPWSFPPGGTLSYPYGGMDQGPNQPAGFSSADPVECFGNVWQTSPKHHAGGTFHPGYWNPPACASSHDGDQKPTGLNPSGLPTRNPWEENQLVELKF